MASGGCDNHFNHMISKRIIESSSLDILCEIALMWMPCLTNEKSTLVQVIAWCCPAISPYLSQCWSRFMASLCHSESINFLGGPDKFNPLRHGENGWHFFRDFHIHIPLDDFFFFFVISISLNFVSYGPLVQEMTRCWIADKPLPEPVMTQSSDVLSPGLNELKWFCYSYKWLSVLLVENLTLIFEMRYWAFPNP